MFFFSLNPGGGTGKDINKHKGSGTKGCSTIKVDFSSNTNYKLGDCHTSALPKAHGKLSVENKVLISNFSKNGM